MTEGEWQEWWGYCVTVSLCEVNAGTVMHPEVKTREGDGLSGNFMEGWLLRTSSGGDAVHLENHFFLTDLQSPDRPLLSPG
jgi:hypothetical protein